jgi:hypothetical protein
MMFFIFLFLVYDSLKYFLRVNLVVMNSLSFCLSQEVYLSFFLKGNFAGYSILSWQFIFFQYFAYIIPFSSGL